MQSLARVRVRLEREDDARVASQVLQLPLRQVEERGHDNLVAVEPRLRERHVRFPLREVPEGVVVHVTVDRIYGEGPWREGRQS